MLDQNTDRMWYVIGAVIIGAAIILIMNSTFPELFANISKSFKNASDSALTVIKDMSGEDVEKDTEWSYFTEEHMYRGRERNIGGAGRLHPDNVYFYENDADGAENTGVSLMINKDAPSLDNLTGLAGLDVSGYGSYEASIKIPEQHGLLNGFFLYSEDVKGNHYEVDMEILYFKGKWELWTTVHNPSNSEYVYGKYLENYDPSIAYEGDSGVESPTYAEPGIIFQKRIDLTAMGIDPTAGFNTYTMNFEDDSILFNVNGQQVSAWNGEFDYNEDGTMELMLSTFWARWLEGEKIANQGDEGWYEELNANWIRYRK